MVGLDVNNLYGFSSTGTVASFGAVGVDELTTRLNKSNHKC